MTNVPNATLTGLYYPPIKSSGSANFDRQFAQLVAQVAEQDAARARRGAVDARVVAAVQASRESLHAHNREMAKEDTHD